MSASSSRQTKGPLILSGDWRVESLLGAKWYKFQVQMCSQLIRKISAELMREKEIQTVGEKEEFIIWPVKARQTARLTQSLPVLSRKALTCAKQLRLPKVLQAWLKSSSSHGGKDEPVPPMQSRLSRLRLLEISRRDGRQLGRKMRGKTR